MQVLEIFPLEIWERISSYLDLMSHARLCLSCSVLYIPRDPLILKLRSLGNLLNVLDYYLRSEDEFLLKVGPRGIRILSDISLENSNQLLIVYTKFPKYRLRIFRDMLERYDVKGFIPAVLPRHSLALEPYIETAVDNNALDIIKQLIRYNDNNDNKDISYILIYCVRVGNYYIFTEILSSCHKVILDSVIVECLITKKYKFLEYIREKYIDKTDSFALRLRVKKDRDLFKALDNYYVWRQNL